MRSDPGSVSGSRWAATGASVVAACAGVLGAFGCVIAMLFERDGFGRPRDAQPRAWYLFALAVGLGLCVAVPGWMLARVWGRTVGVFATVVGVVIAGSMFGITR